MTDYKRLTIFLPEEVIKTLKKIAIDTGVPVSRYIEELVEEHTKKREKDASNQLAQVVSTPSIQPSTTTPTSTQPNVTVAEPVMYKD